MIPVLRFGHCNFTAAEMLLAFTRLVQQVEGAVPRFADRVLLGKDSQAEYAELLGRFSLSR